MQITNLALTGKYDYLNGRFQQLFTFLKEQDLSALPVGKYKLDGDNLIVNVQSYDTTPASKYETHRNYFDLQMVVEGEERFCVAPAGQLTPNTEYNPVKDVTFYQWTDEPTVDVTLQAGDYIIVAPEEAHAPHLMTKAGPGPVKKIVAKIHL